MTEMTKEKISKRRQRKKNTPSTKIQKICGRLATEIVCARRGTSQIRASDTCSAVTCTLKTKLHGLQG
jgi:hypothetical protein